MDFTAIKETLSERYPQWELLLETLPFTDSLNVDPTDNDGRTVFYNSRRMRFYTHETQCFLVAQQILHVQLAHAARGVGKDRVLWRRASDAVVNELLRADAFQLPNDALLLPDLAGKSTEDVYAALLERANEEKEQTTDEPDPDGMQDAPPETELHTAGDGTEGRDRALEDAGFAETVAGLSDALQPTLNLDFDWFPGSAIRDGMLRREFRAYPVAHAEILLDTSFSVDEALLKTFVRACKALLRDAVIRVGCFDTQFYGFQDIVSVRDIEKLDLRGSGGTDFNVAVNAFTGDAENQIIFTDGYGIMPEKRCDAIWVVYGTMPIDPKGGRVIYVKPKEEGEKLEIWFTAT